MIRRDQVYPVTDSTAPRDMLRLIDMIDRDGVELIVIEEGFDADSTATSAQQNLRILATAVMCNISRREFDIPDLKEIYRDDYRDKPRPRTPYRLAGLARNPSGTRVAILPRLNQPSRAEARRHARKRYLQGLRA